MNVQNHYIFGRQYKGFDLLTNLIAYYSFDSSDSVDVVNGYNGTDTAITYTTGKNGVGAEFNGSTSKILISNNIDFTPTNGTNDIPMSWSFWIYRQTNSAFHQIIARRTTNGQAEYQIYVDTSRRLNFRLFSNNSTGNYLTNVTSSSSIPDNSWTHVSVTYDGSGDNAGIKMYINGTEVLSSYSNAGTYVKCSNNGSNTAFGIGEWFGGNQLDGILDEIAIWKNRELTSSEVLELYNSSYGKFYPF